MRRRQFMGSDIDYEAESSSFLVAFSLMLLFPKNWLQGMGPLCVVVAPTVPLMGTWDRWQRVVRDLGYSHSKVSLYNANP